MLNARFVPIVQWPGSPTGQYSRKRARFGAPHAATLTFLDRELNHLDARDVLIQTYHPKEDIRLDGWPKSNARVPHSPGVILTFTRHDYGKTGQTLSFPCDTYLTWEHNLRAIALSLEALRAVDRHGVTRGTEQYRGFEALPPPSATSTTLTGVLAADVLARHSIYAAANILGLKHVFEAALRDARRATHPDKNQGRSEAFHQVQAAGACLAALHGSSS